MAETPQAANNGIPGAIISPVPGATSIDDQGVARNQAGKQVGNVNLPPETPQSKSGDTFDYGFSDENAQAATQHTQQTAAGKDTFDYGFSDENAHQATQQLHGPAQPEQESTGVWGAIKRTAAIPGQMYHAFADKMTDEEKADFEANLMKQYGPEDGPKAVAAFRAQGDQGIGGAINRGFNRIVTKPADEQAAIAETRAHQATAQRKAGNIGAAAQDEALAIEHQLAADIPVVGPFVESAIHRGDEGDILGAAGDVLLPEAAGELGAHVVRKTVEAAKNTKGVRTRNAAANVRTAEAVHAARTEEVNVATDQIKEQQANVDAMKAKVARGEATPADLDAAQTNLSGAVANANKAKQALADAEEARNKAAYEQTRTQREFDRNKGAQAPNKEQIKRQQDVHAVAEDEANAFPSPRRGAAKHTPDDTFISRGYIEEQHAKKPITNSKEYFDAHQQAVDDIDQKIETAAAPYKNDPLTHDNGKSAVMHIWDEVGKSPKAGFADAALKAIDEYNTTDPTVGEAQNMITDLNHEIRNKMVQGRMSVVQALAVDPKFAGQYYLRQWLKNGIDGTLEDRGVHGVRQLREDQAALIRRKNAIEPYKDSGSQIINKSGTAGPLRQMAAGFAKNGLRTGVGYIPFIGPVLEAGLEHYGVPEKLHQRIAPGDITRDQLIQRAMSKQNAGRPVNDIYGEPKPSQTPGFDTPPIPSTQLSPREIREIQRENSPLHAALATHFGVFQGNAHYGELEERFMQDIADKQAHGQELTSSDQKILAKMNDMNAAEDAKARQGVIEQKVKEAAGQTDTPLVANIPSNYEPVQSVGENLQHGLTDHAALEHDIVHHIVANELLGDKLPSLGIRSGSHAENIGTGAHASAAFDWSKFKDEDGNLDLNKIAPHIDDLAAMYVSGGVANAMWHGVPVESNLHLGADFKILTGLMDDLGLTKQEQAQIITTASKRAQEILNRPGVEDVVREHASVREPNLDSTMHFSKKRIEQVLADVKGGINASEGNESTAGAGESKEADKSAADNAGRGNSTGQDEGKSKEPVAEAKSSERKGRKGTSGKADEAESAASDGKRNPKFDRAETVKKDEGEYVYHATDKSRAESIRTSGLRPRSWYANSPEEALRSGAVPISGNRADLRVFRVPKAEIEPVAPDAADMGAREVEKGRFTMSGKQHAAEEVDAKGNPIRDLNPKFDIGKKGFDEQKYPHTQDVKVTWPDHADEEPHFDQVKGLNKGHALARARENWPGANVEAVDRNLDPKFDEEKFKTGLKEKTTGDPARDEAIKQGGGIPASNFGPLSMFHDPETGSTLALQHEEVSPERVKQHIDQSRAAFAPGKAVETQAKTGGFSFNPRNGSVPKDGYMVETHLDRGVDLGHVPTSDDIKKFIADNKDVLDQNPNLHIGGWGNTLGISERLEDEAAAVKAGKDRNQIAIYDVKNGKEIPTGGTGEVPKPNQEGPNPKFDAAKNPYADDSISNRLMETYGTTDNPREAGFILSGGEMVPLKGEHNTMMDTLYNKYGDISMDDAERTAFINNEGAVRTRNRMTRGGPEVVFSVPKNGVSPEQVEQIKKSVGGLRNGNVVMEVSESNGKSSQKEFARVSDVEPMLKEIGALDRQEGPNPKFVKAEDWTPPAGLEKGVDQEDAKQTDIPLSKLSIHQSAYDGAARNIFNKAGSKSEGPVSVYYNRQNGQYLVEDGMHRVVQAHQDGKISVPAKIYSVESNLGLTPASVPKGMEADMSPDTDWQEGPNPKFDKAQGPDTVSARVPEGKNATENPLEGAPLHIGREAIEASPKKLQDAFANKARQVAGVKVPKGIVDSAKVYDRFVNHVAENLKWLYNQVPEVTREANRKWYESANRLATNAADKFGISKHQAAGVIAALSPQMDWDINVSLANRVMDAYKNHMEEPVSDEMVQKGYDIVNQSRKNPKAAAANKALMEALPELHGKKMSELTGLQRAMAIRLYDEVHNDRSFKRIDPATGNEMETRTTANGDPQAASWFNFKNIGKALSILDDDSRKTISDNIGKSHKVRNFYNNIIDPTDNKSVTIDTHAVGAGTLLPVSSTSPEVLNNFGQGGAKGTGVKGMYGLYADAYRKAAADLGVLPRELQSVTWEKVRDLFPAEWKTKANMDRVKAEWGKYTDGSQSIEKTRQGIAKLAMDAKAEVEAEAAAKQAKAQAKADKAAAKNNTAGVNALAGQRIGGLDFLNALRENRGQGNLFGGK